jgi:hypothetical protein
MRQPAGGAVPAGTSATAGGSACCRSCRGTPAASTTGNSTTASTSTTSGRAAPGGRTASAASGPSTSGDTTSGTTSAGGTYSGSTCPPHRLSSHGATTGWICSDPAGIPTGCSWCRIPGSSARLCSGDQNQGNCLLDWYSYRTDIGGYGVIKLFFGLVYRPFWLRFI